MIEHFSKLLASIIVTVIYALAVIWGWNTLFGEFKTFEYDIMTILAVMALSLMFSGRS
jgi:hypothetical protein